MATGRRIIRVLGAVLALLCGVEAHAGIPAGTPVPICVREAVAGETPRDVLADPARFDCTTDQNALGPGDFWALSAPLHLAAGAPLNVRVASLWQDRLHLYTQYADGHIARTELSNRDISDHIQIGALIEFAIAPRDAAPVRLLWQVTDSANMRGILLGARLLTPRQSARESMRDAAIYAAFGGICIALLVYNLALWGALRHRFQLIYCGMVLGLALYAFSSSAALAWAIPTIPNNLRLQVNHFALAASGAAAFAFARSYFEPRIFRGLMARILLGTSAMLLLAGAAVFVLLPINPPLADRLHLVSFLFAFGVIAAALWRSFARKSAYRWLFAIAWAAPIGAAILRALGNIGVIGWSFWLDNSTIIAMAAEALISSLAIAYRIRILSAERDTARQRELVATRLAETDPLTGLLNRRAFLAQAVGRPWAQTLLIADLDHFKRVNERVGHDGGDEVLRLFARILRSNVPEGALVARIGGEEFAVLASRDQAADPARILAAIRDQKFPKDIRVTASIGCCSGPLRDDADWKQLYHCADTALFAVKAKGRNGWETHEALCAAA